MELSGKTVYGPVLKTTQLSERAQNHYWEAIVRCGGKIKYILIAYFLGNICAKNCRNRTVYVKIIASCKGGTFFWDTV